MGVSSLPIQAHGLRSACSPGPASVCAAIQDVGVNPGGISSPGSVGTRCVDLVGRWREGPGGRLAARGQKATSLHLLSLGHCMGYWS